MLGRVVGDYGGRVWWEGWRSVREGVGEGGGRRWERGGRRCVGDGRGWEKVREGRRVCVGGGRRCEGGGRRWEKVCRGWE